MRSALLLAALLGGCAGQIPPKAGPDDGGEVWNKLPKGHRLELPNGLTVVLQENHASPVVALQAWVRVGSADETLNELGYTHVLEHMAMKATSHYKNGEIAEIIESLGGEISA